ncbi:MAG: 16S rRNA (cytosine(1402)-N(4))-methyltransferase [Alphaproteobacteria bacterium CG11_big_fil_rev_8_21_14_0_20_39_49]|nr:MAG: 16S rRNA (cytosine(1402)-N(4))-methyltransferase [Alphaproteobacteria bacterium CG11_big_fil_rev_8_21_14_0_20_39_49]
MNNSSPHYPVMLNEMLEYVSPKDGEVYVDGTFGAGGYSRALLQAADCKVYAIDRDPNVKQLAEELEAEFPGRIELLIGRFSDMERLLKDAGVEKVDAVVLDIGVSSMQIDQAQRGFSFMRQGPLDMRMSQQGIDAAYVVNNTDEAQLADIIYKYGGEKKSRRVASAIVKARAEKPITTTSELASIVRSVVRMAKDKIDPATRTFQALRIWVNDELGELRDALESAERLLAPYGRLVVVTFHSLEDAIVKEFVNKKSGKNEGVSRHLPIVEKKMASATFRPLCNKAVKPSEEEISINIRSRSAKLRAAEKLDTGGIVQ